MYNVIIPLIHHQLLRNNPFTGLQFDNINACRQIADVDFGSEIRYLLRDELLSAGVGYGYKGILGWCS